MIIYKAHDEALQDPKMGYMVSSHYGILDAVAQSLKKVQSDSTMKHIIWIIL